MTKFSKSQGGSSLSTSDTGVEKRLFYVMTAAVISAVAIALWVAPWRITAGLLLGGSLSLLNYHWMRTSVASLIENRAEGNSASSNGSRYILRYFVVAGLVSVAYLLKVVSLPATIIGLCSFVVALFAEACMQFYFSIVNREGTN